MMAVDDLWRKRGPDGKPVPSGRDSRGKRYRVRYADPSGKPQARLFDRKGDAERFDLKVRSDVARGEYVDPRERRQTFRERAELWRLAQPHKPNTVKRVLSQLNKHIYPAIGDRPIAAILPSDVQAFVSTLTLTLKPRSVRVIVATVDAVFGAALRDRVITYNPTDGVKLPTVEGVLIVPLSVEQVDALITALPRRYQALGIVAAGTGMRGGELFGLQVHDIDFLRRSIRVERQVQPHGVVPLKSRGGSRASYRSIPVGQFVIDALAAHLAEWPARGTEFVFRTPTGEPLHAQRIMPAWRAARKAAGLPTATPHDLRHHYASALIRAGLDIKVISARLGHTNAAMTLNVYGHLWPDNEDRTRQAIDDMWLRREEGLG